MIDWLADDGSERCGWMEEAKLPVWSVWIDWGIGSEYKVRKQAEHGPNTQTAARFEPLSDKAAARKRKEKRRQVDERSRGLIGFALCSCSSFDLVGSARGGESRRRGCFANVGHGIYWWWAFWLADFLFACIHPRLD